MNRPKMFPQKSRLQVAIALEKLAYATWKAQANAFAEYNRDNLRQAFLLADICELCNTRLITLLKPCLYEHRASFYHHIEDRDIKATEKALRSVRGWRLRHPQLLDFGKEN